MIAPTLRQRLEPALRKGVHLYFRPAWSTTTARTPSVIPRARRVFLVRHTYVSGWYLPGGGVEVGQTFREALEMELREEGRIVLTGEPVMHGVFLNDHVSFRDHVAVYVVRAFQQDRLPEPNNEIAETGFFARDALPPSTTEGTQQRLAEVFDGKPVIPTWRTKSR